jgi:hypothetical protein
MYMFLKSIGAVFHLGAKHVFGQSSQPHHQAQNNYNSSAATAADTIVPQTVQLEYKLGVGNREALAVPVPDDLKHFSKKKQKREMKKRWLEKKRRDTPGFSMRGWRRAKRKAATDAQERLDKATSLIGKRRRGDGQATRQSASSPPATKIPKLQEKKSPRRHLEKVSQHVYRDSEYGALPTENGLLILGVEEAARAAISLTMGGKVLATAGISRAAAGKEADGEKEGKGGGDDGKKGEGEDEEEEGEEAVGQVVGGVGLESASELRSLSHLVAAQRNGLPNAPIFVKSGKSCTTMRCLHSSVYQRIADTISDANRTDDFMSAILRQCEESQPTRILTRAGGGVRRGGKGGQGDPGGTEEEEEDEEEVTESIAEESMELAQYQKQWRQRRKLRNQVKQMIREQNPTSYYKDVVL